MTTMHPVEAVAVADPVTGACLQPNTDGSTNTKDAGPAWETSLGVDGERFASADQSSEAAAITDAPESGQKLVITDILISTDTALTLTFSATDGEDTKVLLVLYLPVTPLIQATPRGKLKVPYADATLDVQASAAGNIAITALYHSEA